MDRRTFLALSAAALVTAGCTSGTPEPSPEPTTPTPAPDPDEALRRQVAESEAALITRYREALSAAPDLATLLVPLLTHHEEHLDRMGVVLSAPTADPSDPVDPGPSASPPPTEPTETSTALDPADPSPSETEPTPPSVADPLAALAEAERTARAQRISACDGAADPGLARELCLIAASEAQHAALLRGAGEESP